MENKEEFKVGDKVKILMNKNIGIPENKGVIVYIDFCDKLDGPPYQVEVSGKRYWLGDRNIKLLKK